jgi:hypothetical protein
MDIHNSLYAVIRLNTTLSANALGDVDNKSLHYGYDASLRSNIGEGWAGKRKAKHRTSSGLMWPSFASSNGM